MMRQHTRLIGWLMALLAMAGFTALGLWQLQRMHAKQAMLDAQGPAVAQALPLAQRLYLTDIDLTTEGDAFFPDYQAEANWQLVQQSEHPADAQNPYHCYFRTWQRQG